jgi:thiol-disulfide isomerase/thioredoxin
MRKILHAVPILVLLSASPLLANNKILKAEDILKASQAKAADQHKTIFLVFTASWCEPCHQMETFLAYPEITAIFDKYFIVATLTFGEGTAGHPDWDTPGADSLVFKYGGLSPGGTIDLPFVAVLDARAKLIANSNQPGKARNPSGPTGGFPTQPNEINYFLSMLQKSAPAMTPDEMAKIQDALKRAATE